MKRTGREADHLPPFSAGVKKAWSFTSTEPRIFMASCLVKYKIRLHGVLVKSWYKSMSFVSTYCSISVKFSFRYNVNPRALLLKVDL